MHRLCCVWVVVAMVAVGAYGQGTKQRRPASDAEMVAQDVILSGTTTLSSSELTEISNALSSVTMHDSDEEVEERIKYEFMQHGYFDAEVTSLKVTVLDPLAPKRTVKVEAEVKEGPLFRLELLIFKGGQPFAADELYALFDLKPGDVFNAEKVRKGLEALREKYAAAGFLNFAPIPSEEKSGNARIALTITIETGPQFLMSELKFEGPPEIARRLADAWTLKRGAPYDPAYLDTFITANRGQLPESFTRERDVAEVQDCPQRTVSVTFRLDPKAPPSLPAQSKPCEQKDQNKEGSKPGEM